MEEDRSTSGSEFEREVEIKEKRKLRAEKRPPRSPWLGFSLFGLIGWSVAVPALLGILVGIWLDRHHPGSHSWTLMLLSTGIVLGCMNAWYWVKKENREMNRDENDNINEN